MDEGDSRSKSVLACLAGANVLVTGATGFIGKVLIEKLLRCVPNIGTIYLLVRPSKGQSVEQRVHNEIFLSKVFSRLRRELGDGAFEARASAKLKAVSGDLVQMQLGISDDMERELSENLHVIWHGAASIDFNLRLDQAIEMNVKGSLRVLELAKRCRHLRALVHVSTAYSNCNRLGFLEERLYPIHFDPNEVLKAVSQLSVRELQKVTIDGILADWPNTYTFTKFITEHLLHAQKGNVPLAIVRPSIVAGAWREPVPGWIDCISAVGALYIAIGFGVVKVLPGNKDSIGDVVPVDFVVNTLLLAVPHVIFHPDKFFVCHAAVSTLKPWRWSHAMQTLPSFWERHPPRQALSKVQFSMQPIPALFEIHMFLRYSLPASIIRAIALVGTVKQKRLAQQYEQLVGKTRMIVDAFSYFTTHEWLFDASVTMSLLHQIPPEEKKIFWLCIDELDATQYHRNFCYGLLSNVIKENLMEIDPDVNNRRVCLNEPDPTASPPHWLANMLAPNLSSAINQMRHHRQPVPALPVNAMKATVLSAHRVQSVIEQLVEQSNLPLAQIEADAADLLEKIVGDTQLDVMTGMAALLRKVFHKLYESVLVNAAGLERIRQARQDGPIIYLPTHRSYIDFLVVSYMCFLHNLPIPFIASTEDFLGVFMIRWLFRNSGAFFIRRTLKDDPLYSALLHEYVRQLLVCGQSLEFFIEGTRSRSGKMLHPKMGMLSMVTTAVLEGDIEDATIVPISISYERTLEDSIFKEELLGASKIKESLQNLVRASKSFLSANFGKISINIGETLSTKAHIDSHPLLDRRDINRSLAYQVAYDLSQLGEVMPTHMVAAVLLLYRQGLSRAQLLEKILWLIHELRLRKTRVALVEAEKPESIVDNAIAHLRPAIVERRRHVYEPKILSRSDSNNMLLLGHYRNKMMFTFFRESIWACALHSLGDEAITNGACKNKLFEVTKFLYSLLQREVIDKPDPNVDENFEMSFQTMIERGIFQLNSASRVEVQSEAMFSFLCSLCWPFVDSYFVTAMSLHILENNGSASQDVIVRRAQWLGTTLYHESMLCFFESCSSDTLKNAMATFDKFQVLSTTRQELMPDRNAKKEKGKKDPKPIYVVKLAADFQDGKKLQKLIQRIDALRKRPPVSKSSLRRALMAEIPALAKL